MNELSMAHTYLWEDESTIIDYLARQLLQGKLSLVLGSGISVPFGLPQWSVLLENLYKTENAQPDTTLSLEEQAEVFRTR